MSRAFIISLLTFALLLTGLTVLRGSLLAMAIPFLLYLFYGILFAPDKARLDVHRTLSAERVSPQTPVVVSVSVTNCGETLESLAIEDVLSTALSVENGSNHHLISLGKDKTFNFAYTLRGPRGGYALDTVRAEASDHLGLLRSFQLIPAFGQLFVFPPVARLRQIPIRPRRTRVYAGSIPARTGGAGVEFFGVRNYQPGDPPRAINWHVSARHEELYSNEFQQERVADVGIILDGRQRSNIYAGGHSLFEHSIIAAAALADSFLAQGNRVGLLVYGQYLEWTWPGYGKLQREKILHSLSHTTPGISQVFDGLQYLPTRMFPPESQIVLVSPLMEDDYLTLVQLRARGYQVMVVSPDPVAFEEGFLPSQPEVRLAARVVRIERELMLNRIQRAGVQLIEWNVSQPFDQATRLAFGRGVQGSRK